MATSTTENDSLGGATAAQEEAGEVAGGDTTGDRQNELEPLIGESTPKKKLGKLGKSGSKSSLNRSRTSLHDSTVLTIAPELEGATAADDLTGDPGEQAPPLPEKVPLSESLEEISRRHYEGEGEITLDSSSSSSSSEDDEDTREVTEVNPASQTEVAPPPEVTATARPVQQPTSGDVVAPTDVTANVVNPDTTTSPSSPNEPPPPYPGGPLPGADPYGPPAPPAEETRVVQVIQASGNCEKCQAGNVIESFTFLGICLGIWCFPCGLICLFCMRQKKCSHCGAKF